MLAYSAICSLDGYVADREGKWDWSVPDEEVHRHVNDLERPIETYLMGRRMYDVLSAWETMDDPDPVMQDYARIWRAAEKVVYSRTLENARTAKTQVEREFDPGAVRAMKVGRDLSIGGPELAAQALRAGLVDQIHLYMAPVAVGGGTRALPEDLRLDLELADVHRFANGTVYLKYLR